ncbi:FIG001881: hydrolase of alkaline phosphatase superfamily [Klebsiella pneumoniae IS10]|nr:FIG001881: hydrolase of alkaline phosphatase superfamily [Klebsiella pneumoniae IS10]
MVTLRQPYREKVSQMVSWGHWFALFNMLLAMVLGSRYLFVADWPTTLAGRLFSYVSLVGHFSFLVFTSYVLILFPLTFIVVSQRLMRFLSVILATAGMTLLLIDSEVFTRFHLHLNPVVWELVINPDQNEMARDWQLMFISVPVIFLIEMLFATWSWQKLRSLTRRRHYARPVAWFFFLSFVSSHLVYIWADANFYRPITMQRANLPLSYPMTARRFLEKHGLLDAQDYQRRLVEQGAPEAVSVQYPLSNLRYRDLGAGYNVLLITVDNLNYSRFEKTMPALAAFAKENVNFTQHMSSGNTADSGLFGLFYGISPGYMDGVLSARIPAALITALNQQATSWASSPPMGLAARCIARLCSPISRCRARRPRATSRRPISGSAGWTVTRRMRIAGSRGSRSMAPPSTTRSSRALSAATARRLATLMPRSIGC